MDETNLDFNSEDPGLESEDLAESFSFLTETRTCLSSPQLRRSLRTARTWVLTLAVMASCWVALVLLLVLGKMVAGQGMGPAEAMGFLLVMLVFFAILGLPVALMFQFAARTSRFIHSSSLGDLVSLLRTQRWLWTVLGVLGILVFVVNFLAISLITLSAAP